MDVTSLAAQTQAALIKLKELRDTTSNPRLQAWLTLRIAEAERMLNPTVEMPRLPRRLVHERLARKAG
jgi:hypothetical protein